MRITEIIIENSDSPGALVRDVPKDQMAAIKGARTSSDLSSNKSDGNAYQAYRHGLALACAGAGNTPDAPMPAEGSFSGDPLYVSYSSADDEMLDRAGKIVNSNHKRLSKLKSEEQSDVIKHSPVPHNSGVRGYTAKK